MHSYIHCISSWTKSYRICTLTFPNKARLEALFKTSMYRSLMCKTTVQQISLGVTAFFNHCSICSICLSSSVTWMKDIMVRSPSQYTFWEHVHVDWFLYLPSSSEIHVEWHEIELVSSMYLLFCFKEYRDIMCINMLVWYLHVLISYTYIHLQVCFAGQCLGLPAGCPFKHPLALFLPFLLFDDQYRWSMKDGYNDSK